MEERRRVGPWDAVERREGGIMDGWEKMRDEAQTDDGERLRRRETIGTLPLPPSLPQSLIGRSSLLFSVALPFLSLV